MVFPVLFCGFNELNVVCGIGELVLVMCLVFSLSCISLYIALFGLWTHHCCIIINVSVVLVWGLIWAPPALWHDISFRYWKLLSIFFRKTIYKIINVFLWKLTFRLVRPDAIHRTWTWWSIRVKDDFLMLYYDATFWSWDNI